MTTYTVDGMKATLVTATTDSGEDWNGFAVPVATRAEVDAFIDQAVALDGIAREDIADAFDDIDFSDGAARIDGHTWALAGQWEDA